MTICGRPNPEAGPGGYVAGTFGSYPHFCRCTRQHGHPTPHRCGISTCKAEWNPPDMDPEHPALQRPWPPHVGGGDQ